VFNFHLSQLHIKIEQSFRILVNKWRVFKKPLEVSLTQVPAVVECCMRLHNFCMNERNQEWCVPDMPDHTVTGHTPQYEEYLDALDEERLQQYAGGYINACAQVCEAITKQLAALGCDRPFYNKRRNLPVIT
jgi:chloramphenicol O-acetyltransferase